MLLPTDILAIIIALLGCVTVMILFWKQNHELHKEIRRLQITLRDERKK
jgi:uncharacterized membrane protein YozB (DUF420 family)